MRAIPTERSKGQRACGRLHWNISGLFHHSVVTTLTQQISRVQIGLDIPSYLSPLFRTSDFLSLSPSLSEGLTICQLINHQLRRKHKERNSWKATKDRRMHRVYSTCITPSGERRGRAESNKADLNCFLHLTEHKHKTLKQLGRKKDLLCNKPWISTSRCTFWLHILRLVSDFSLFL